MQAADGGPPVGPRVLDAAEKRLLDELTSALGMDEVGTSAYRRAMYRGDASILKGDPLAVCMPRDVDELATIARACHRHGIPFVPRGAGTSIAAGTVPAGGPRRPVVIGLNHLDHVRIDADSRTAEVGPGVVNSQLDQLARTHGLRFAPDPSSQTASTIGGNIATNAGGAHCLAYGVTSQHVLRVDLMDAMGRIHRFGDGPADAAGYDLRGLTVGSEGCFGFVTSARVRLLPAPPTVEAALISFPTMHGAATAVTRILAARCSPAAMELMDRGAVELIEAYVHAGFDDRAAAVLLIEFEGLRHQVAQDLQTALDVARSCDASNVQVATDAAHRDLLWKGRKAVAGAIARVVPDYYLHDVVVPRSTLADTMDRVIDIGRRHELRVINVFHAGDGNLHPLLLFDRREPGIEQRLLAAGHEIVKVALEVGGVLSGEHGIGLEKRDLICEAMSEDELDTHWRVRDAMDPSGLANAGKVLPRPHTCGEAAPGLIPEGAWL